MGIILIKWKFGENSPAQNFLSYISITSVVVYNMGKPSIGRKVWIKLIIAQLINYPQPYLGDLILLYIHLLYIHWNEVFSTFASKDWGILLSPASVGLFVSWFVCTITHNVFPFYATDVRYRGHYVFDLPAPKGIWALSWVRMKWIAPKLACWCILTTYRTG